GRRGARVEGTGSSFGGSDRCSVTETREPRNGRQESGRRKPRGGAALQRADTRVRAVGQGRSGGRRREEGVRRQRAGGARKGGEGRQVARARRGPAGQALTQRARG